jgi:glycosyltransferase involved in cell wall biosynthesis
MTLAESSSSRNVSNPSRPPSRGRPGRTAGSIAVEDDATWCALDSSLLDDEYLFNGYGLTRDQGDTFQRTLKRLGSSYKPPLTPFIDYRWYLENNRDVAAAGFDPFEHFCRFGLMERRSPHPLISIEKMLDHCPELLSSPHPIDVFKAYLTQGRYAPSWYFEIDYYLSASPTARNYPRGALAYFLESRSAKVPVPSKIFEWDWYCDTYRDVPRSPRAAFLHFVRRGDREGRAPGPQFNPDQYLALDPEAAKSGLPPLLHFLRFGQFERRSPPQPLRQPKGPAVARLQRPPGVGVFGPSAVAAVASFREVRAADAAWIRQNQFVDEAYYLATNTDVAQAHVDPVWHYLTSGEREGRAPSKSFDPHFYMMVNPDVRAAGLSALMHFERHGRAEGRQGVRPSRVRPHIASRSCVLFVGHDAHLAGAEVVLLNTIRWMSEHTTRGIKIILLGPGSLMGEFASLGDLLVTCDPSKDHDLIRQFVGNSEIEFVYANSVASGRLFSPVIRSYLKGAPVLAHIHELSGVIQEFNDSFVNLRACARRWICVSDAVLVDLTSRWGVAPDQAVVMYPPISPALHSNQPVGPFRRAARISLGLCTSDFVVMCVGTVYHRKDPDLFVQVALSAIASGASNSRLKFVWIGEGEDRTRLEKEVEASGASRRITFTGPRSDAPELLAAADLFLLTSREDPFPLVCLEAAQFGVPTMCLEGASGFVEFIGTDAGYVAKSRDPHIIADAVDNIFRNKPDRIRRGSNARKKFNAGFTLDVAMLKFEAGLWNDIAAPAVTVIVPNYNHARFLAERLDSIWIQSIRNIQIILLDDASTDASVRLLKARSEDPRVKVVVNKTNSGNPFHQWSKGLALALAEFVWIAESDDTCDMNLLSELLRPTVDGDVSISYAKTEIIDESGAIVPGALLPYLGRLKDINFESNFIMSGAEFTRRGFGALCAIVNASSAILRRNPLLAAIDTARSFAMCGDWLVYLELLRSGEVAYSIDTTNYFRRHPGSVVHTIEGSNAYFDERTRIAHHVVKSFRCGPGLIETMLSGIEGELERFVGRYAMPGERLLSQLATELAHARRPVGELTIALYVHGMLFSMGGIERLASQIANFLSDSGHDVTVFCKGSASGASVYPLRPEVKVEVLDLVSPLGEATLQTALGAGRFDVFVPMLSEHLFVPAIRAACHAGVSVIASEHNDPWVIERDWWNRSDRQLWFSRCDGIHVLLPKFLESLDHSTRARAAVIPNGVDLAKFRMKGLQRQRRIVAVGRLVAQKDYYVLVDAFALLADEFHDWTVHIFGAGELQDEILERISSLGLDDRVYLRGLSSRIEDEMNMAELFVIPSAFEGFGTVLVEAMACGLPCIAFHDCNGPNEILRDGTDGLLVAHRDAGDLSAALALLMSDDERRAAMRKQITERAQNFDLRCMMIRWETYLLEVVVSHRDRTPSDASAELVDPGFVA